MLMPGQTAPAFSLPDQNNTMVNLDDLGVTILGATATSSVPTGLSSGRSLFGTAIG